VEVRTHRDVPVPGDVGDGPPPVSAPADALG
jgi:hypothetical protein